MQAASTEPEQRQEPEASSHRAQQLWFRLGRWRSSIPFIYLAVALPVALLLCYLIPPTQTSDEGRHFLRACQFAEGQILPQIDPSGQTTGGLLPAAAVDFVRDKMNPNYYRAEDRLHTIGARLRALDAAAQDQPPLSQEEFGIFPESAVYPPALYLPQTIGIRLAQIFSPKIYIWFYAARVANAITAVVLIFIALLLAPGYRLVLLIPAILPMSLYQISSVSSDAGLISISILFAALCLRFIASDGWLIRAALVCCLFLLTLGKPVYLPFALLLLPAYKRLGWRRAISFCAAVIVFCACSYLVWSYFVRAFIPFAGSDFRGHNPSAQLHFVFAHPSGFAAVLLHTLQRSARGNLVQMIGIFGWSELPLPRWFYPIACALFLALIFFIAIHWKKIDFSRFWIGCLAIAGMLLAITLGAFILWTPVGATHIPWLQGRYFIPVLAVLPFLFPFPNRLHKRSQYVFACLVLCFFALSVYTTVRIVKHYYFPVTKLLGKNVDVRFQETAGESCPASGVVYMNGWFSSILRGQANVRGNFLVLVADKNGTILGESDPVLAGSDFPYTLLPAASHSQWVVHFWTPDRFATLHYWLIRGNDACTFGPSLEYKPYPIPSA